MASNTFISHGPLSTYESDASATRRLESARRAATDGLLVSIRAIEDLEGKLNIGQSWTEDDPAYQEAERYLRRRDFHRALDKVQQLVVQRLFEMSKANIAGMGNVILSILSACSHYSRTGYKMRTSIWKALKRRGKAIRTAIDKYNKLAATLDPPAPTLDWKNVVNYTFISEFDLLRHSYSRTDINSRPWILQANREIATRYFKVVRAREEIRRLDIEIRRLFTAIHDEQQHLLKTSDSLALTDPAQAAELQDMYHARVRVNQIHLRRLRAIMAMPGYSGSTTRGIRSHDFTEPSGSAVAEDGPLEIGDLGDGGLEEVNLREDGLNDDAQDELAWMGQFVEDMAVAQEEDDEGSL